MNSKMTVKELYENVRDGKIKSDIDLQREIVYSDEKKSLVIDSIVTGVPLPAFYFWKNDEGILEVLDGKQRIESIKRFKENDIKYNGKIWMQTDHAIQKAIDDTELTIIICEGSDSLKREIFKRINTLGVALSQYEVLNGLFHGEYLRGLTQYVDNDRNAKKILGANTRGKNQISILEMIKTIKNIPDISDYVKTNQSNSFANDQRLVQKYVNFIADVFDSYTKLKIYFALAVKYERDKTIWVSKKTEINSKIYTYLHSDDSKLTNQAREIENIIQAVVQGISVDSKRLFSRDDKLEYLRRHPELKHATENTFKCEDCGQYFYTEELQMDHIKPWSKGGRTVLSNAQVLCPACNKKKGNDCL